MSTSNMNLNNGTGKRKSAMREKRGKRKTKNPHTSVYGFMAPPALLEATTLLLGTWSSPALADLAPETPCSGGKNGTPSSRTAGGVPFFS
jgi:hypothetical protein